MKTLLLAASLWLGLHGAALAMTIQEQLVSSLNRQGYSILEEGYTFLGRLRIVATKGDLRREIVVNPGTGEILRDYVVVDRNSLTGSASVPKSTALSPASSAEPALSGAASPVALPGLMGNGEDATAQDDAARTDADAGESVVIELEPSVGAVVDEPALTLEVDEP